MYTYAKAACLSCSIFVYFRGPVHCFPIVFNITNYLSDRGIRGSFLSAFTIACKPSVHSLHLVGALLPVRQARPHVRHCPGPPKLTLEVVYLYPRRLQTRTTHHTTPQLYPATHLGRLSRINHILPLLHQHSTRLHSQSPRACPHQQACRPTLPPIMSPLSYPNSTTQTPIFDT